MKTRKKKRTPARLQKKGLVRKIIGHYWICQLRNGVFRPMNLTKLTNKVERELPAISNLKETRLK